MHAPIALRTAAAGQEDKVVVDLFCGAGSLSAGIEDALRELGHVPVMHAVNHWDIATQTYALNHPGAQVHCVSLDAAFPSHVVPGLHVDLLAAGIECTYFSRARGGRPVNDQQRMSPWHVIRWCTELNVDRLLLENVPEILKWGPCNIRTGKPIKNREGEYYEAFNNALEHIGLPLDTRVINCAEHGDPTTRTRWFGMARRGRKSVNWPASTYAKSGDALPRWRAARECIDWSIHGRSIFDRDPPLAANTIARIAAGITRFRWPEPFIVVLRQHCDARSIELPVPTLCAAGQHIGLCQPVGPQPFVLSQASGGAPRSTEEPLQTIPTGGAHALIAPYYSSGSGLTCTSVDSPLPAATTRARFGLVTGEVDGARADILYRMFQEHELAAAMSISTAERPYVFAGNKTERIRQIGQAVPRRTAYALAKELMSI